MKRPGNSSFLARLKRVFVVATCLYSALAICFSSSVATALSDEMLDKFAANNIMFYDPDDKGDSCVGEPVNGNSITYIGDSISDGGAYANLKTAYTGLDGEDKEYDGSTYDLVQVSKRFAGYPRSDNYDGLTIAAKMVEKGDMRPYLIFALGTNDLGKNGTGSVSDSSLNELAEIVGNKTKVMLVSGYGLHDTVDGFAHFNEQIKAFAASHSNFSVADWYTTAISDPTRYISDSDGLGVHLTSEGTSAFVDMLKNAIGTNWVIGSSGGGGGGDNRNYAGDQVWTDEEMAQIEQNRPFYEAAAQPYGFPWQLMAVIHYQETGLSRTNPSNGQGLYQLYSLVVTRGEYYFTPGTYADDNEFAEQTSLAADFLHGKIANSQYDINSNEGIMQALVRYNGEPYPGHRYYIKATNMGYDDAHARLGEGSIYVMNRYDEKRDPTHPEKMDPNWPGYFTGDNDWTPGATTTRFGTFVRYQALGGGGSRACTSENYGDFIGYVKRYAWPEYHNAPFVERMPDYGKVVDERVSKSLYTGDANFGVQGIDCGGFVTTLLTESGFEPEYNYSGQIGSGASNTDYGQRKWLVKNPDKWELVNADYNTPIPDESALSPGDVAFTACKPNSSYADGYECGHTYVYIGEVEGFQYHIASASTGGQSYARAPMAGSEGIITYNHGTKPVIWFHKK